MRKILNKMIIILVLIMLLSAISMPLTVNAWYQANKNTASKTDTANNHFVNIRNMESRVLNKEMNLEVTTYLDNNEGGNGLDCHMALNTEWGTAAMLAISAYGGNPAAANQTTTQNESGIYNMIGASGNQNYVECVAGIYYQKNLGGYMSYIAAADSRYRNDYTTGTDSYHKGDALTEITWVGGSWVNTTNSMFFRFSSLFGFSRCNGYNYYYVDGYEKNTTSYTTRAVVVCGEGL